MPIISLSYKPMELGTNILQTEYGLRNLYTKILEATKLANTPYVAIAEDDTLYTKEHFNFRPPKNKIGYDINRWVTFTWGEPFYFHKPMPCTGGMIAPKELLIKALEERMNHVDCEGLWKEPGRNDWERKIGLTQIPTQYYYGVNPFLCFNHDYSVDRDQIKHRKKTSNVKAYDIPIWGRAEDIRKKFI